MAFDTFLKTLKGLPNSDDLLRRTKEVVEVRGTVFSVVEETRPNDEATNNVRMQKTTRDD